MPRWLLRHRAARAAPSRALSCARADWGRSAALRRRQDHEDRRPGNVSPAKRSWPAERFGLARQASRRFLIVTSHGGRILLEIAQDLEFELFGCQWVAANGFEIGGASCREGVCR